jgi:hypothetical protein
MPSSAPTKALLEFVVVLYRSAAHHGDDVKAFMAAQQRNLDSANDESGSLWFP